MAKPAITRTIASLVAVVFLSACAQGKPSQTTPSAPAASAPPSASTTSARPAPQQSKEPIKIGFINPLTGPIAAAGNGVKAGAQIAVDEINAAGGVHGRPLQLLIEDGANDPATTVNAANKLITRDNVQVMIGAWGSSATLAMIPVIKQHRVPLVVETSSSWKITHPGQQGNEWVFRISPPSVQEAASLRGKVVEELGLKKVFFLAVNNDWGRGAAEDFKQVVLAGGGEVVGTEYFEQAETNFTPLLTRVKNSPADSVILTTDAVQIALIFEQAASIGLKQKWLTTSGSNFPDKVMELGGKGPAEGTYHITFYAGAIDPSASANPERARKFNEEWKRRRLPWTEITEGSRGYDGVYTVAEALKLIGSDQPITREAIRNALTRVEFNGIMYGRIKFGKWRELINQNAAPSAVVQVVGGKAKVIIPPIVPPSS